MDVERSGNSFFVCPVPRPAKIFATVSSSAPPAVETEAARRITLRPLLRSFVSVAVNVWSHFFSHHGFVNGRKLNVTVRHLGKVKPLIKLFVACVALYMSRV